MAERIPTGDHFIEADVIRWKEAVFKPWRKKGRAVKLGDRVVVAEVLRQEYERSSVLLWGGSASIPSLDFAALHHHIRASPLPCGLTKISRDRATRLSSDGASSRDNPPKKSRPSRARERAKSRPTYACPKGTVGGQKDFNSSE